MSPHVKAYFSELGKKGKGASKRRDAAHYARLAAMKRGKAKETAATVDRTRITTVVTEV